ncbi:MAG TPA: sigma 54-interacting transcriptional regulator [Gemmatimonadaceae bacterium]
MSVQKAATKPAGQRQAGFESFQGSCPAVNQAIGMATRFATSPIKTGLIAGEAGTGKELLARCIHNAGPNATAPFVAISCAALPAPIMELELFGQDVSHGSGSPAHKMGILELAGEGTVLLKDVGELSSGIQARLERTIQVHRVRPLGGLEEIPIHCRIIATTKVNLEDRVASGSFGANLLSEVSKLRIDLPPLRERGPDIRLMADFILADVAQSHGGERKHLGIDADEVLRGHRWPGNVRELRHVLERAVTLTDGGLISAAHMIIQQRRSVTGSSPAATYAEIRIPMTGRRLRDIEREALEITMQFTNQNQSAAARLLGIARPTLARKLREYGLQQEPPRVA